MNDCVLTCDSMRAHSWWEYFKDKVRFRHNTLQTLVVRSMLAFSCDLIGIVGKNVRKYKSGHFSQTFLLKGESLLTPLQITHCLSIPTSLFYITKVFTSSCISSTVKLNVILKHL